MSQQAVCELELEPTDLGYLLKPVLKPAAVATPIQEQDKSSDIQQQSPFGDRKYCNTLPQKRGKNQASLSIMQAQEMIFTKMVN